MQTVEHKPSVSPRLPLSKWIWQSYAKTALVPVLLVELALIVIYVGSNYWSREQNLLLLRQESMEALQRIAGQHAHVISEHLETIDQLTKIYADQARMALATPAQPGKDPEKRYRFSDAGVFY